MVPTNAVTEAPNAARPTVPRKSARAPPADPIRAACRKTNSVIATAKGTNAPTTAPTRVCHPYEASSASRATARAAMVAGSAAAKT
ncbi:hypothetical protein SRABI128_02567 [Microbacterium sp. Bi128]|nr:hypothetical protein SRABI128_02567 [Microbacterium sp. Bi128]